MSKKNKLAIIILLSFLLICIIVYIVSVNLPDEKKTEENVAINLFFLNSSTNMLESETRIVPAAGSNAELVTQTIKELKTGPKSSILAKTLPSQIIIKSPSLQEEEKIFELGLSSEYLELPVNEQIYCLGSLVWTFTDFDFIDSVLIYVEGEQLTDAADLPMGYLTRENVNISPDLNPYRTNEETITLYFPDEELLWLEPEARTVTVSNSIEYSVVEQLIQGPIKTGHLPSLASDIKIKEVYRDRGEGICYVDFSQDFLSKQSSGSSSSNITIYSIVNSLTELPNVTKVQILVDSAKVSDYGGIDISRPLERNEEIIQHQQEE